MAEPLDVVVVGAGPAGLSCAAELGRASLGVALVDAGHGAGGQYWRQPVADAPTRRLYHDLATFDSLRDRVATSGTRVLLQHHVWAVVPRDDGYAVHVVDRSGGPGVERELTLHARAVVIATGAHDRALPFPGWDLPGVMTVGGLQALLKSGGVGAGRRVALGGTGPFLLPVAVGLAEHGSRVVGVHEVELAATVAAARDHAGPQPRQAARGCGVRRSVGQAPGAGATPHHDRRRPRHRPRRVGEHRPARRRRTAPPGATHDARGRRGRHRLGLHAAARPGRDTRLRHDHRRLRRCRRRRRRGGTHQPRGRVRRGRAVRRRRSRARGDRGQAHRGRRRRPTSATRRSRPIPETCARPGGCGSSPRPCTAPTRCPRPGATCSSRRPPCAAARR